MSNSVSSGRWLMARTFDPWKYSIRWEPEPETNSVNLVMEVPTEVAKERGEEIKVYLNALADRWLHEIIADSTKES